MDATTYKIQLVKYMNYIGDANSKMISVIAAKWLKNWLETEKKIDRLINRTKNDDFIKAIRPIYKNQYKMQQKFEQNYLVSGT